MAVGLNFYALTRCRCVDVLAVTEVDAHVVCAAAPKYEVARLQIREGYRGCCCLLGIGNTWNAHATFFVYVLYKAAAVKTGRGSATPYIRNTDVFHSGFNDAFTGGFFYKVRVYGVGFEGFPECCFLVFDKHEGIAAYRYNAVGECLHECHWRIGHAIFNFDAVVGTVFGE